ncbi:MAG: hypothetical protein M1837_001792 [Sclerophora amabilis]|nr:MAG: hypothetical protein M1837_001792 [Sclerophora amabilis]
MSTTDHGLTSNSSVPSVRLGTMPGDIESSQAASRPDGAPASKPIVRHALRYSISTSDYELLHKYLISRWPALRKKAPSVSSYEALIYSRHDYNAAAVRASTRIFLASQTGLKAWELIKARLLARGKPQAPKATGTLLRSPNFRLSLSLSTIFLFHRLLYRFFTLLRRNLLAPDARPFRVRNPRTSRLLVSKMAPAIGASLAGFMLGVYPADQLRMTIAIYTLSRAGEFLYNKLEEDGWFKHKPWWFGSWLLFPVSCGQLLHAFIFDRECFPSTYGDFIINHSGNYIQRRPDDYPANLPWPDTYQIMDTLATVGKMKFPPFISPILFPNKELPSMLTSVAPVVEPAHPAIANLTCAMLHPNDPSCLRSYITYFIQAFPGVARFFTMIFAVLALPRYRAFLKQPVASVDQLARSILKMSLFITGAIGTSWGMICFFQQLLPRTFLPTQRFFLGGFVGGLWGFLQRKSGRRQFMYSARLSMDSAWKVGVKRGWVRGFKNGDVWLFVACLALSNALYEVNPAAINSGVMRRILNSSRGAGFVVDGIGDREEDGKQNEGVTKAESPRAS